MQLEGLKVQIKGEDGVFTVGKMIVNSNNPLNCEYQVIDANGNDKLFTAVRNFLPVVGDDFTIYWQDSYDITCPHCQKEMNCEPSLFHKMGQFSIGGGSCPNCHEMMSIEFNPYANRMTTEKLVENWSSKMASKPPKCTIGKTHKWQWVKNFTAGTLTATSGCFTKKGWYRCECGAEKEGKPQ